jgi:hypothetical protein
MTLVAWGVVAWGTVACLAGLMVWVLRETKGRCGRG